MTRGPRPSTRRSPSTGGTVLRARVSADEYARAQDEAHRAGHRSIGEWIRSLVPDDAGDTLRRTLRLPVSVWEALEAEAKVRGCSVAEVVVQLVSERIKESR